MKADALLMVVEVMIRKLTWTLSLSLPKARSPMTWAKFATARTVAAECLLWPRWVVKDGR